MRISNLRASASAGVLLVCLSSAAAHAQTAAPAPAEAQPEPETGGLEDIVVTARRSNEALQTTPVAVTALSNVGLERAQITAVADLQRTAPSLSVATGGAAPTSIAFVAIRGQGQNEPTVATDPAVGIYIDGVYIARPTSSNLDLLDLARAEVLRGPQGTLFGRNTVGGALSLTTNAPTGDFEGLFRASVGNYDYRRVEGMVNIPLTGDELAVRFAGSYHERGGFGRFVRLDRPAFDVRSNYYVRGQLRWAPNDKPFELTVAGDYARYRDSGQLTGFVGYNPALELAPGFTVGDAVATTGINPNDFLLTKKNWYKSYGYNDTNVADLDKPQNNSSGKGVSANLKIDLGGAELQSITAYREATSGDTLDLDSLPINLVSFIALTRQKQFSEELQLSGKTGNLDWIGGVYYFLEKGYEGADAKSFGILDPNAKVFRNTSGDARNGSKAVYGQVNYHLTDRLRATAGIRYTWDTRKLVLHTRLDRDTLECAIPPDQRDTPGGACDLTRDASFDYPAWTAGLDYKLTDSVFVYAKTSGASMAGGWNLRDTIAPAFKPEDVRDVEGGFKGDFLDRRVRFNAAFFHAWQNNVQRNIRTFDPVFNALTSYTTNAGKARTYGAEFEATVIPWHGMEVTGSLSLLRAKYVKGTFLETQVVCVDANNQGLPSTACVGEGAAGTLKPFEVDRSGEKIPQAPRTTWNIGATQNLPLDFGTLTLHADYAYISKRAAYQNTAADQQTDDVKAQYDLANRVGIIPSYGLLNGRIALEFDDPGLELAVWGRNLTRKKYVTNVADFITAFGVAQAAIGEPRTYGVTVGYKW